VAAPPPLPRTAAGHLSDRVSTGVVVVSLVGMNLSQHVLHLPWWVRPLGAAALVGLARWNGLTWAQLGLARERMPSGARWGLGGVAVVGVVYTAGALLPVTRPAFLDTRYDLPLPGALYSAFVVIPLGTVLPEELAFRSVLWGTLARFSRPWQVLATTSVLFGLWHVLPALQVGATNDGVATAAGGHGALVVLGTVGLTTVGGLVFGELRRRSGSVLAGAGAHWATNALGVLFGVAIRHAAG
jgi:membrane protease YdiL (CAAX protease family)